MSNGAQTHDQLATFEELLYQVDLSMFARRRKRHKVSHVVLPALLTNCLKMLRLRLHL